MPLCVFHTMVKESQNDQKLKSRGGPALKLENVCLLFDCRSSPTAAACQSPSVHAATFWMEELRVPYA